MLTFTFGRGGTVSNGIELGKSTVPAAEVGEAGRGRFLATVTCPIGAVIVGREAGCSRAADPLPPPARCPECNGAWDGYSGGHREIRPGILMEIPARPEDGPGAVVVLFKDQSGFRGGWELAGALDAPEWARLRAAWPVHTAWREAMPYTTEEIQAWEAAAPAGHARFDCKACLFTRRPHGLRVIAEGRKADGIAGRVGGGPEYLAVIRDGQAVEVRRSGRLYGAPKLLRLSNSGGALRVSDPEEDAANMASSGNW